MTTSKNGLALRHVTGVAISEAVAREGYVTPAVDIFETAEAYVVRMDLPGAKRESMKVRIDRGTIDIQAPVDRMFKEGATVLHSENAPPGFYRSFVLGEGINPDNIDAGFENGVLTLKLSKAENAKPREITIQ